MRNLTISASHPDQESKVTKSTSTKRLAYSSESKKSMKAF